ncbi:helix-turn-helix transcriptional regulator [Blastococcus tunisiensis]|uniref:Predicted DNA-binding transcriptional regulator YafY, contains an HTH and WYL domains n=1 Tax=Blastococcus tunisiensis TaxID=1798228 RepID=A0A1I2DP09_9ACTN|nr:WYL domain-containing protein [Blastococcus sp. DSM 46838]SFE82255.1 Predicted DNA-binding transcriptional regulator YafY, contains an HTH and WYL domains [Blastococcus sp. DSM 46838]
MPRTSAPVASQRLLRLLSLLQARRDWPGPVLGERLQVSERTLRRDIDRLRELGYPISAVRGPDGGYRLDAGSHLPPLLFDDEQAVALAVALRTAVGTGAGIEEAAARALGTVRQVMPTRLRARIDSIQVTPVERGGADPQADPGVLLDIGAAIRAREELRFDYRSPAEQGREAAARPPRQVQPHHLVARGGRWYLVGWDPHRGDWRIHRADRVVPRTPNGPRFVPREVPGGDVAAFLAARFRGSSGEDWPCRGMVVLGRPASEVLPFAGDGTVEERDPGRCLVRLGSWSWAALAATLARFDAAIEVVDPPALREAFADLAARAAAAAAAPAAAPE